jgi:hypothetical protein
MKKQQQEDMQTLGEVRKIVAGKSYG